MRVVQHETSAGGQSDEYGMWRSPTRSPRGVVSIAGGVDRRTGKATGSTGSDTHASSSSAHDTVLREKSALCVRCGFLNKL